MENETELKPCPFCGNSDMIVYWKKHILWIECSLCGCKSKGFYFSDEERKEFAEELATQCWNRRA